MTLSLSNLSFATPTSYSLQNEIKHWQQSKGSKKQHLNSFYKIYWNYIMLTYPENATYQGFPGQNDRWSDHSLAAVAKSKQDTKDIYKALQSISEKGLDGDDLMNYRLFLYSLEENINNFQFPSEYLAINQMGGVHSGLVHIFSAAPKKNLKDYMDRISRLKAFPTVVDQSLFLLQEGLKKGITPPKVTLKELPSQFDKLLNDKIEENPLYESFKEISENILTTEQIKQVQTEAQNIIRAQVIPSLKKMKDFLVKDYIPHCREAIGWSALPNGKNWYNSLIKNHTTLDMTADQIFQLGQNEVTRIQTEMAKVREQLKFKGDEKNFRSVLTDSKFYYKTEEDLIRGYRNAGKQIDPELTKLFGKLPRLPYGIKAIPAFMAPTSPAAYYEDGSQAAGRAGYFAANTYDLSARPKWSMMDLTCHEAVPGHHLQISIAKELEGLPDFRKNMGFTSYVEGWALYAETLCDELGLYKDPYDKYGHLIAELFRATRLVVDTAIHSKGWIRDQVVQYLRDTGPFAEQEIQSETDRYIVWPGQALGYKIGQLKFKELREKLNSSLGEKFDVRQFHDAVLGSGALPLPVLEKKMLEWGKQQSLAKKPLS